MRGEPGISGNNYYEISFPVISNIQSLGKIPDT